MLKFTLCSWIISLIFYLLLLASSKRAIINTIVAHFQEVDQHAALIHECFSIEIILMGYLMPLNVFYIVLMGRFGCIF